MTECNRGGAALMRVSTARAYLDGMSTKKLQDKVHHMPRSDERLRSICRTRGTL